MPIFLPIKRCTLLAFLVLAGVGLSACQEKSEPAFVAPMAEVPGFESDTISLTGRVILRGTPPTPDTVIDFTNQQFCGTHGAVKTERWKVAADGGLAEAVVCVLEAPPTPRAEQQPVIDQKNCAYTPHVVAIMAGGSVTVLNSDATFHNVRVIRHKSGSQREAAEQMHNHMTPKPGDFIQQAFNATGLYRLECDVHRWMQAWIYAAPNNHYAVSRADGTFAINHALKDGTYTAEAWHPQFAQPLRQSFTVTNGKADLTLAFDASQAFDTTDQ